VTGDKLELEKWGWGWYIDDEDGRLVIAYEFDDRWNGDECSVSVRGWMGDMQCEKRREREAETKRKARRQSECGVSRSDAEANYTVVTDRIEGLPGA